MHFIRYYPPKEYAAFGQNWDLLQNSRGAMVFANGDGILKYDGVVWEFHSLPNLNVVRSLAMDENGRVYVGAYDELGYLDADSLGAYSYVSLLPQLTESQQNFGNIHRTVVLDGAVLFRTEKGLLIWKNERFREIRWPNEREYKMLHLVGRDCYVQFDSMGLCLIRNNKIESAPGGEFFRGSKLTQMLAFDENHTLIITATKGLYLYNHNEIVPFETEIDEFLIDNLAYCGIRLPNGDFAIGTIKGGAFIFDKRGSVKSILNQSTGLGDNSVYDFGLDSQGALWAALSNGISRIEVHSPFSMFNSDSGLQGSVNGIVRYQGVLYVGTSQGLFRLLPAILPDKPARFEMVEQFSGGIWGIINHSDALIVNSDAGAYLFKDGKAERINAYPGYSLIKSRMEHDVVFSGLNNGVSVMSKKGDQWVDHGRIRNVELEISDIAETDRGDLWLGTFSEGAYSLKFPLIDGKRDYLHPSIRAYGEKDGLSDGYIRIYRIGNQELFHVKRNELQDQLFRFDPDSETFIEYANFTSSIGLQDMSGFPISNELNGRFWITDTKDSNRRIIVERRGDKGFDFQHLSFARLAGYSFRIVYEESGIAWWGGHDGLIRIEEHASMRPTPFNVLINKISFSDDSVLFTGSNKPVQYLKFPAELNSIRFEYAATSFDAPQENQYQYLLEGFDNGWSAWTKETIKSYTRIPGGAYTFKVRGKNINGNLSAISSYSFSISPPWFRSWWAYALYVSIGAIMVAGIVQWRLSTIRKEKEKLEKIVLERTREVKAQAEQLEKQAVKLTELDRAKSHFFANISHEFRTPLTLILGIIENLSRRQSGKDAEDHLIIRRSAIRLQTLINQLLDLSKLEARELKLTIQQGDINWFLRSIAAGFNSYAVQRNINYQITIPDERQEAFFDSDKLEKMISNLLSNAFKFTPAKGRVVVSTTIEDGWFYISVSDTGKGIPVDQTQKIFERFYQVDPSHTRLQEGAGIGLALTKELVELHQGRISVKSREGEGSLFQIALPITHDAYTREQIGLPLETQEGSNYSVSIDRKTIEKPKVQENAANAPILLIVEDNADLRQFIAAHLSGFKIIEADNGLGGFKKALRFIPNLIVSDIMMPEMDGVELCRKLKADERTSHIPVILLTAKADAESKLEGLGTGADDYITKPFNAQEIQIRIMNLITQREKLKERFSRTVVLKPQEIAITPPDEIFLEKVMSIIERHIDDSEFSTEVFQHEVAMSRMQLHRKLKALTGHSAGEFVRVQRLIRAGELLSKGAGNVSDVCYQTGFSSLSYFTKCFKKQFGHTPSEYSASQIKSS